MASAYKRRADESRVHTCKLECTDTGGQMCADVDCAMESSNIEASLLQAGLTSLLLYTGRDSVLSATDGASTSLSKHVHWQRAKAIDHVACLQVTDRAAAALSLKADGEEVSQLRLFVKGQFAEVRAAVKEGAGRGRLSYTTGAGHTLCLSCDQPLAPLSGHTHEPLAPQGVSTILTL